MECSIITCKGHYEATTIMHTVRHKGQIVVIDHVPAEICSVCGDVLLSPETIRGIEAMLENLQEPEKTVPLFEYSKQEVA